MQLLYFYEKQPKNLVRRNYYKATLSQINMEMLKQHTIPCVRNTTPKEIKGKEKLLHQSKADQLLVLVISRAQSDISGICLILQEIVPCKSR